MGSDTSSAETIKQENMLYQLRKQLQKKNSKIQQLMKQQRTLCKQSAVPNKKISKEYTMDTLMKMNTAMFTCSACQNFYDEISYIPIMICTKQHSICQTCFKIRSSQKNSKCTQCNEPIKNHGKNRSIQHFIGNKQQLLAWVKQRDGKNDQNIKLLQSSDNDVKFFPIHFCTFSNHQQIFEINQNSILKLSEQNSWHTIRSTECLQAYDISQLKFKVINSVHNSLIVGVTTKMSEFQKACIPSQSVALHFNNGHIYDQNDTGNFSWRAGGQPLAIDTKLPISMVVDVFERKIKWIVNKQIYGQAILPKSFKDGIYVFLSMYHKGDMVVFNK